MTSQSSEGVLRCLTALRTALRQGALLELGALAHRLAAALDALEAEGGTAEQLHDIARAAEAVQVVLPAAEAGLASARQRLEQIRAVRLGEGAYGVDGRRYRLSLQPPASKRV